jgi:hypothetical protein
VIGRIAQSSDERNTRNLSGACPRDLSTRVLGRAYARNSESGALRRPYGTVMEPYLRHGDRDGLQARGRGIRLRLHRQREGDRAPATCTTPAAAPTAVC